MVFKRIECFVRGVICFIKHGFFTQHLFAEVEETPAIIIATDTDFRVSDNYQHESNETVYPNATLIQCQCIRCGHIIYEWKNNNKEIPII